LRSHVAGAAAVAGFFFVALVILLLVNTSDGDPAAPPTQPSATAAPAQGQSTLLVQVTLDRVRAASILTATGGEPDQAVMLSLPQDLLVVDGSSYTPLLDANLSLNRRLTALASADTLGVRVDGGWRMERKALAGFVDSVGGITVVLDAPVTYLDSAGLPALTLPAGASRLTGPEASWYAIGVVEGEDPIVGIQTRFAQVFTEAVKKLPDDVDAVSAMLTSLGALSDPLQGTTAVAAELLELKEDFVAGRTLPVELPLRASAAADPVITRQELDGGPQAAVGAFRVTDYVAATPTLREVFAGAPRIAGIDGEPRVLVWNASAQPLASQVALLELSGAGFVPVSAGSWTSVEPRSQINGLGYLPDGVSYTTAVAEALRLAAPQEYGDTGTSSPAPTTPTPTAVAIMPAPDRVPWADVDVAFGEDYQPCPANEPNCLEQEQQ
jgi:hypothetical protein